MRSREFNINTFIILLFLVNRAVASSLEGDAYRCNREDLTGTILCRYPLDAKPLSHHKKSTSTQPPIKKDKEGMSTTVGIIGAGVAGSGWIIKKLNDYKNNKKKNKKFLIATTAQPLFAVPVSTTKKPKTSISIPPSNSFYHLPSEKTGKAVKGKNTKGKKRQSQENGRAINAASRHTTEEEKKETPLSKHKPEKFLFQEKTLDPTPPRVRVFDEKVNSTDYSNFAYKNAKALSDLLAKSSEIKSVQLNNIQLLTKYLAFSYFFHRHQLNKLDYQYTLRVSQDEPVREIRNLFVHGGIEASIGDWENSFEQLRKIIPARLASLMGRGETPIFSSEKIDKLNFSSGPTRTSLQLLSKDFGTDFVEPELKDTDLYTTLDSKAPNESAHTDRFFICDSTYINWVTKKIIPLINLLAAPLLKNKETALLDSHYQNEYAALKLLMTHCGEFYHDRRNITDPILHSLMHDCREKIRNVVAHSTSIDKSAWDRTGKRHELDVSHEVILEYCQKFRSYLPSAHLIELAIDSDFSCSLRFYVPPAPTAKKTIVEIARSSRLNPAASSFSLENKTATTLQTVSMFSPRVVVEITPVGTDVSLTLKIV